MSNEIKKWNWGAFFLTWIWGIGNNVYISFLAFIAIVNIIMSFVLGAKGNEWAWKQKKWESIEKFEKTQKNWAIAGLVVFLIVIIAFIPGLFIMTENSFKQSDAHILAMQYINSDKEMLDKLGKPIKESGMSLGGISHGSEWCGFPIKGSLKKGRIFVRAKKEKEKWVIKQLIVSIEGSQAITLIGPPSKK